jgi:hypothetical protein
VAETHAGSEAGASPAGEATTAIAEEMVLNAAVAFAGHVATAAQQSAEQTAHAAPPALRQAVLRQYLLETATLCLRRLGESYAAAGEDAGQAAYAALLRDGATQAAEARAAVEALGDLGLDLLDRLIETR